MWQILQKTAGFLFEVYIFSLKVAVKSFITTLKIIPAPTFTGL